MVPQNGNREKRALLLTAAPQDAIAIQKAFEGADIVVHPCFPATLAREFQAGLGALVMIEEAMTAAVLSTLSILIADQPSWSDVPLLILAAPKSDRETRLFRWTPSIRNATILERPMRIETLVQSVRVALRSREQQYRLRDQIEARERLLVQSETNERRLSAVLNNTRMAVFFMNERQECTLMNAAAEKLTGYSLIEMDGRLLHDAVHHTHPDGRPYPLQDCPIDRAFPENSQTDGEEVFVHKNGHFYPVAFTASPIRQDDVVVGTVLEVHDITRQKADTEHLHMLINELNHRVKNTLATVQSILRQTMKDEPISAHAREAIMSRLLALSRSHDLLTEESWVCAPLRALADSALSPFGARNREAGRFIIEGPDFDLSPKAALAIAMSLHELATNAVKYGSLSTEQGVVHIGWAVIPPGTLQMTWTESGGPPVTPPTHRGFGRRLIERGLAHELHGQARIDFEPGGVVCTISVPVEKAIFKGGKVGQTK